MKLKILALTALLTLGMAAPVIAKPIVDLRLSDNDGPGIIIVPARGRYRDYDPRYRYDWSDRSRFRPRYRDERFYDPRYRDYRPRYKYSRFYDPRYRDYRSRHRYGRYYYPRRSYIQFGIGF